MSRLVARDQRQPGSALLRCWDPDSSGTRLLRLPVPPLSRLPPKGGSLCPRWIKGRQESSPPLTLSVQGLPFVTCGLGEQDTVSCRSEEEQWGRGSAAPLTLRAVEGGRSRPCVGGRGRRPRSVLYDCKAAGGARGFSPADPAHPQCRRPRARPPAANPPPPPPQSPASLGGSPSLHLAPGEAFLAHRADRVLPGAPLFLPQHGRPGHPAHGGTALRRRGSAPPQTHRPLQS